MVFPGEEMTRSVDHGFSEFAAMLVPSYSEPEAAARNLIGIEACLKREFGMSYLVTYGSTGHGTNVKGHSPIDCFAVIEGGTLDEDSGNSLKQVRDALRKLFPDAVVTGGRPVVAISFGDLPSERHHVVPAYPIGRKLGHDIFGIPGPRGRWIESSPGAHSAWINRVNDETGNKLKPLIRLIKAWNYFSASPLWSHYLEICAIELFKESSAIIYSSDLMRFFRHMQKLGLTPVVNAVGSNEPVYGTSIDDRQRAIERLKVACRLSREACDSERRGDIADAFYHWRKLFKWHFPAF